MTALRILVIDDEPGIRFGLHDVLASEGYEVLEAADGRQALEQLEQGLPDLVLLDHLLGDTTGLELIPRILARDENLPIFILTAHGSIDLAVRAIKAGAEQFITKPVDYQGLTVMVRRSLEQRRDSRVQASRVTQGPGPDPFLGTSPRIQTLRALVQKVLQADAPLLLLGETGTGKSLLARWIHDQGPRSRAAFLDLNCAGIQRDFLESELFGHEKGAFTGAAQAKQGLLELAHQGTVFLDEVGDMDTAIQVKLLKVLEEKRFRRMGGLSDRRVDLRLIAATHQDLEHLVAQGRFRSDLLYRINALTLTLPPLRERVEDLPRLVTVLLEAIARDQKRPMPEPADDTWQALREHPWPGNIRELRNALERACLTCEGKCIHPSHLALARPRSLPGGSLDVLERQAIEEALRTHDGHVGRAAKALGISRSTLYERVSKARS
jgi:DNA-binding NtrC family response regulator